MNLPKTSMNLPKMSLPNPASVIARHILINRPYPKALPAIKSNIGVSLPARFKFNPLPKGDFK